jgi:hypothetical protein
LQALQAVLAEVEALAIDTLKSGAAVGASSADEPTTIDYEFVNYGENHETITWRDRSTGNQFTLPVDVPPGYRNP